MTRIREEVTGGEQSHLRYDSGKSIDGFDHLGVDHFTADFVRTRKYLPKDYNEGDEFTMRQTRNEKNELVSSAVFKDLQVASRRSRRRFGCAGTPYAPTARS